MKVIIDINGEGTAKGAGEYFIGDTLTLQAIPEESVEFGYWLIADNETLKPEDRLKVSDNPFTIQVTPQITAKGNMKVEAYFYMSMRGKTHHISVLPRNGDSVCLMTAVKRLR